MMEFHVVRKIGGDGGSLVVIDPPNYEAFLWVKDTGLFHRDRGVITDYFFPDPRSDSTVEFEEVSREKAVEMMKAAKPLNRNYSIGRLLHQEYMDQLKMPGEVITPADAGLMMDELPVRPTASKGLPDLLEASSRRGAWTTIYRYSGLPYRDAKIREGLRSARTNKKLLKAAEDRGAELLVDDVPLRNEAQTLVRVKFDGVGRSAVIGARSSVIG